MEDVMRYMYLFIALLAACGDSKGVSSGGELTTTVDSTIGTSSQDGSTTMDADSSGSDTTIHTVTTSDIPMTTTGMEEVTTTDDSSTSMPMTTFLTTNTDTSTTEMAGEDTGTTGMMSVPQPSDGSIYSDCLKVACNPGLINMGQPDVICMCTQLCTGDADCPGLEGASNSPMCVMRGQAKVCVLTCDGDHPCPTDMQCLQPEGICMSPDAP